MTEAGQAGYHAIDTAPACPCGESLKLPPLHPDAAAK